MSANIRASSFHHYSPTEDIGYNGDGSAEDVLAWALKTFSSRIAIASSFSLEDGVLLDMGQRIDPEIRVFALDTGRLNEETYAVAEQFRKRYELRIEWFFPATAAVERLEREQGLYSFRESREARRACCGIRKVEPLRRALLNLDAWITGMRRDQSVTRSRIALVENDSAHAGMVKVNPLVNWSEDDVLAYCREHDVPINRLYDRGYSSIGCAPCTRAIKPGEHPRAGRWWWEAAEQKECGLHSL